MHYKFRLEHSLAFYKKKFSHSYKKDYPKLGTEKQTERKLDLFWLPLQIYKKIVIKILGSIFTKN